VAIVAGFQGVDPDSRDVTTLGRGGSDTTAVAFAASLGAERCEICTDVSGVFTADPRVVPEAVLLDRITYEEMIALAVNGAGVLTEGAVDFGRRFSVPIQVRSSFTDGDGTWVVSEADPVFVRGIAHRDGAVTLVGSGIAGSGDLAARGSAALEGGGIRSTMTVGEGVITYLVAGEQTESAVRLLHSELRPPVILEEVGKR
jgi:aspartate kinase